MEINDFNNTLKNLTTILTGVVKEFIKDKPELVRRTGIESNPDFKLFTTELHIAVLKDAIIVDSHYCSGGVKDPSNFQKTEVVKEFLPREEVKHEN